MNKYQKHNELIKSRKPSEWNDDYWIYCLNRKYYLSDKATLGKWCIYGKHSVLDKVWKKLIPIVENNDIINCAKIRTGSVSLLEVLKGKNNKTSVICVYTYDFNNKEDVFKVRDLLRSIGIRTIIKYKTEQASIDEIKGSEEFLYIDKIKRKK